MAGARRRSDTALIARLFEAPQRFRFFQAVRILEHAARKRSQGEEPGNEPVRFRAHASLAFPAAEIVELKPAQGEAAGRPRRAEMTVAFFGLAGVAGVLPQHYTALLIRSIREKSLALRDFLDLFNHRLITLFARAWGKYRLPIAYERSPQAGADPISEAFRGLVGLATDRLRERGSLADEVLLHYSGLYAHYPRSAAGLAAILTDYFARPVRVEQFHGRWLRLGEDEQSALGSFDEPQGRFAQLGASATVGSRFWDVQGGFRLHIGPLDYAQFVGFMPDGQDLGRLDELTRRYVGPALGFDVQLTLDRDAVPECRLGSTGPTASRLGWNTWLKDRPFLHDPADAVFLR